MQASVVRYLNLVVKNDLINGKLFVLINHIL